MAKCLHREALITEKGEWFTEHHFVDGKLTDHNNTPGNYYATFEVHCLDCGIVANYTKHSAPKWVRALLVEIGQLAQGEGDE